MHETKAKAYMYDVQNRKGIKRVWNVYADNPEEAEENAKTVCRLLGAVFLGNMTEGRTCKV